MHKQSCVTGKSGKCLIMRLNLQVVFSVTIGFFFGIKLSPNTNFPINLVQNKETGRGSTVLFKYDVTKNAEQTCFAYSSADLELVKFHLRKFAGKAAIFKTITIKSHPGFMKGQSLKITPQWLSRKMNCWWITCHYDICPVDSCVHMPSAFDLRNGVIDMRTSPHMRALLINNNPCGQHFTSSPFTTMFDTHTGTYSDLCKIIFYLQKL